MADLTQKLKKQVEFYFSDSNFPRDKFLRAQAAQDEEGYVPLSVIASFARMKQLSTDTNAIADAIKDSSFLKLSSDNSKVKRITPLPEEDTLNKRSIIVKGLPDDATIDTVSEFFAPFGTVLSVRLRRKEEKKFKGSAFVELSSVEEANAAVSGASTQKFGTNEVKVQMKSEWYEEKMKRRKQQKRKADDENSSARAEKKQKTEKNGKEEEEEGDEEEEEEASKFTPGLMVRFKGAGANTSRESLKAIFGKYGEVAYADFSRGETEGYVRFATAEAAEKALAGMKENKEQLDGVEPELSAVQGEDEKKYWEKVIETKQNRKASQRGRGGRGRGGRGRGGRGGRNKRRS